MTCGPCCSVCPVLRRCSSPYCCRCAQRAHGTSTFYWARSRRLAKVRAPDSWLWFKVIKPSWALNKDGGQSMGSETWYRSDGAKRLPQFTDHKMIKNASCLVLSVTDIRNWPGCTSGCRSAPFKRGSRCNCWSGRDEKREGRSGQGAQGLHLFAGKRTSHLEYIPCCMKFLKFLQCHFIVNIWPKTRAQKFEDIFCFVLSEICSSVYRQQLTVALMMHFSQQFSGINAVSDKRVIQFNIGLVWKENLKTN